MSLLTQLRIGPVTIRPATILAPMAGITDTVFRRFIQRLGGCGLIMTEFTSAEGITRQNARTQRYLYYTEEERPISGQIFGSDPDVMAEAAAIIEALGFDLVDINLGCPARKVVKCGGGSNLLRDLPRLEQIFKKVRATVRIPLTIKIRAGWDENEIVACKVARMAEACGVNALALHPRTRVQGFSGEADWKLICEVKQAVRIPVIGNGDIRRPQDAVRMLRETGCDAIMIGRSAAINPWVFRQIGELMATGRYREPTEVDRYELIIAYYRMIVADAAPGGAGAIGKMKQFASWFTHGVEDGATLRREIQSARTAVEVIERVEQFFEAKRAGQPSRTEEANLARESAWEPLAATFPGEPTASEPD